MLDLQKYTKLMQLKDKLDYFEFLEENNKPFDKAEKQNLNKRFNRLYSALDYNTLRMKVNLKQFIHTACRILNRGITKKENIWQYYLKEVEHKHFDTEHFYGHHSYDDYVYQVVLTCGGEDKLVVCTANRVLRYSEDETIDLLHDNIHPAFSLRQDETSKEFDQVTLRALKQVGIQTFILGERKKKEQEKTLIQQRIKELEQQLNVKNAELADLNGQLFKMDDLEHLSTSKK